MNTNLARRRDTTATLIVGLLVLTGIVCAQFHRTPPAYAAGNPFGGDADPFGANDSGDPFGGDADPFGGDGSGNPFGGDADPFVANDSGNPFGGDADRQRTGEPSDRFRSEVKRIGGKRADSSSSR